MGAGRQDVNVSCRGGSRVEIKGVAHTKWIPELTHNEAFRQWALLHIREQLLERVKQPENWKLNFIELNNKPYRIINPQIKEALLKNLRIVAINLPAFKGILSHFTQPGQVFADELQGRIKVIACLERPFMFHSEELSPIECAYEEVKEVLKAGEDDAQILLWGPWEDVTTAIETIEERCLMAFKGVPNETRKSLPNGTTIFERVLPGADRMYPDTDSSPIPLENERIEKLGSDLPSVISERYQQLKAWNIPEDTYTYIFSKNLYPLVARIISSLDIDPVFVGTFIGHTLKYVEGHYTPAETFNYKIIYAMLRYLQQQKIDLELASQMLPVVYEFPKMDFDSILETLKYKRIPKQIILDDIPFLKQKFREIRISKDEHAETRWIMGELRALAVGNISLKELRQEIEKMN
jgi:glutamyl-tRNA(Gln) amidotransferase subunit E